MKRVFIICEGQTEQAFCNTILSPYFVNKGIDIRPPIIKQSKGGIVEWEVLKKQITDHLKNDTSAHIITSLIDYYGIKKWHNFPKWEEAEQEPNKNKKMEILEQGMKESIEEKINFRFIPYIQLHEFESLLFSDMDIFYKQIPSEFLAKPEILKRMFRDCDDPEMINNNKDTSPSHRLERIIHGYNKVLDGTFLAKIIGLPKIREKCPRFNCWLNIIESHLIK